MTDTVQLLDKNAPTTMSRGSRHLRGLCIAVLLLLPSLYLLADTPHHNQIHNLIGSTFITPTQPEEIFLPPGYLIWNSVCKIPDLDPFEKNAMFSFRRKKYVPCSTHRLTYVLNDANGDGVLYINSSAVDWPLSKGEYVSCCYSNVTRSDDPKTADSKIIKSKCTEFNSSTTLLHTEEFIITKCIIKNRKNSKKIREDAHTNIQITSEIKLRLESKRSNLSKNPWSVLIVGIDTLSRINLARAMPETHKFLVKNSWLDFQAYNKIDDNTYPNLMAFLTGRNQSRAREVCEGRTKTSMDDCEFIWKQYEKIGYATAHGEDYVGIDTFGKPAHKGFSHLPADHYLRPLFMAAEKPMKISGDDRMHCTGQTTSGEALFNYGLSFVEKYKKHPFFGFLWANTFSHDDVTSPTRMDLKMHKFFEKLKYSGALDNTIVVFISDHGIRYGNLRASLTGYYEERLPALYIWLPTMFKKLHPQLYDNMVVNTKRLTSPYDVYITLSDILNISTEGKVSTNTSEACPTCHSLFQQVAINRSCQDAAISSHWCTCNELVLLPANHATGIRAIQYTLDKEIEKALNTVNKNDCRICAKLHLQKVVSISIYNYTKNGNDNYNDYLLSFSTNPGSMVFESTVRHFLDADTFETQGIVSRLTPYKGKGGCVKTAYLKKYCYCTGKCKSKKT